MPINGVGGVDVPGFPETLGDFKNLDGK